MRIPFQSVSWMRLVKLESPWLWVICTWPSKKSFRSFLICRARFPFSFTRRPSVSNGARNQRIFLRFPCPPLFHPLRITLIRVTVIRLFGEVVRGNISRYPAYSKRSCIIHVMPLVTIGDYGIWDSAGCTAAFYIASLRCSTLHRQLDNLYFQCKIIFSKFYERSQIDIWKCRGV